MYFIYKYRSNVNVYKSQVKLLKNYLLSKKKRVVILNINVEQFLGQMICSFEWPFYREKKDRKINILFFQHFSIYTIIFDTPIV